MHYTFYTTSKSKKMETYAAFFIKCLMQSPGREATTISVKYFVPKTVKTKVDDDGDVNVDWDWFSSQFQGEKGQGVAFHFTPAQRKKWGIKPTLNGAKNTDNKIYPEFWLCADVNAMAKGYDDMSEVERLLLHENGHFEEDLDDLVGNKLTQQSVHILDYELKAIHKYPALIDFRKLSLLGQIRQLLIAKVQALLKARQPDVLTTALSYIGKDASPADLVEDALGCAETVSMILRHHIDMPVIPGTWTLQTFMAKSPLFTEVSQPVPGAVIISPTGTGNGKVRGHTGIVGRNNIIMSNDSYTGLFMANYTVQSWTARYKEKGGMPVLYYKLK